MRKITIKLLIIVIAAVLLAGLTGCSRNVKNPEVTFLIDDFGEIVIELYPKTAPNTVNNFISLVESGYYEGKVFHRIIRNFVIQAGSMDGDGQGGPGHTIKGEFPNNGFRRNDLKHIEGTVSMARTGSDFDSASAQFFIVMEASDHLDGDYAVFGRVKDGMDIARKIAALTVNSLDRPLNPPMIEKATVETFGVEYKEPDILQDSE